MAAMNPFDMLIVVILSFCLIRGIFRGLIKEVASIVGVLAGFYAAYTYYPSIQGWFSTWVSSAAYRYVLSFLVIFCVVFLFISILGVVIKYLLNIAFLGWVDRICGAGFGFVKAVLIVSVLMIALTTFLTRGTPIIKDSLLAPHVTQVAEKMIQVVPQDMKSEFQSKIRELKRVWNKQKRS
jgi:membrane protein required for colicin V production